MLHATIAISKYILTNCYYVKCSIWSGVLCSSCHAQLCCIVCNTCHTALSLCVLLCQVGILCRTSCVSSGAASAAAIRIAVIQHVTCPAACHESSVSPCIVSCWWRSIRCNVSHVLWLQVRALLQPSGPLFGVIYRLMSEPHVTYEFPAACLPVSGVAGAGCCRL